MAKVTAIIQARLDSKRLPEKAILPLANIPLIEHVFNRTAAIPSVDQVVLATSNKPENKKLIDIAVKNNIAVYIGSHHNVLDRYYQASKKYPGDFIVRVTGDNPFMDPDYAEQTIQRIVASNSHLCSIKNLPLGVAVEVFSFRALQQAYMFSSKVHEFEHVSPFIKQHKSSYRIDQFSISYENPFDSLRLTVDTEEDYKFACCIYENLGTNNMFLTGEIITFLQKNPHLIDINSHIYQRKMTEANV